MTKKEKLDYTLLRIISITTGLLLLPVVYIGILSGTCIRLPGLVETITLGLLGGYSECSYLHLQVLPLLLSTLTIVHTIATIELIHPITKQGGKTLLVAYTLLRVASWILVVQVLIATIAYYVA